MTHSSAISGWTFEQIRAHAQKTRQEVLAGQPVNYLIDVREKEELAALGTIPNAIHVPLGRVSSVLATPQAFSQATGWPAPDCDRDWLVFSCQHGVRAMQAATLARQLNYANVAVYPGSFADWAAHAH